MDWTAVDHRRLQYYCVRELPRAGKPLQLEEIAVGPGRPLAQVCAALKASTSRALRRARCLGFPRNGERTCARLANRV
jgi:hypothetical protein